MLNMSNNQSSKGKFPPDFLQADHSFLTCTLAKVGIHSRVIPNV